MTNILDESQEQAQQPKSKIGIFIPSFNWNTDNGIDYFRKMASANLQARGYDVVPIEKYPLITPKADLFRCPQSHYAAAAEIIRMLHEDQPDVLWAIDGGQYAASAAQLLDEYGKDPKGYIEKYSKDPVTGQPIQYGVGAEGGFEALQKKAAITGHSDVGHIQVVMKKYGFPSIYAPCLLAAHPEPHPISSEQDKIFERTKDLFRTTDSTRLLEDPWFRQYILENGGKALEPTLGAFAALKENIQEPIIQTGNKISGKIFTSTTTIVASSLGTDWQLELQEPSLLMLEIMGSPESRLIDELDSLKRAGALKNVKAIVFGVVPEPQDEYDIKLAQIKAKAQDFDIPFYVLPKDKTFGHFKSSKGKEFLAYKDFTPLISDTPAILDGGSLFIGNTKIDGLIEIPKSDKSQDKTEHKQQEIGSGSLDRSSNTVAYGLRYLFDHKGDLGQNFNFAGKNLVIDLSGDESCFVRGNPFIYLQSIQNAGVFDGAKSVKFKVSGNNNPLKTLIKEAEYVSYFAQQLQESGKVVGSVSVTKPTNLDLILFDAPGKQKAKDIDYLLKLAPKLKDPESKDPESKDEAKIFKGTTANVFGCSAAVTDFSQPEPKTQTFVSGRSDFLTEDKVTEETTFEIASCTKMITAATILRMTELDKAKFPGGINTKLSTFFPKLKERYPKSEFIKNIELYPQYEQISLRDLLQHTHGMGDCNVISSKKYTGKDKEDQLSNSAKFGTHVYSKTGTDLTALIIEAVSGERFAEMARNLVITPLKLKNTKMYDEIAQLDRVSTVHGYMVRNDNVIEDKGYESALGAWGARSSATDMSTLGRALLTKNLEHSLFESQETLDEMQKMAPVPQPTEFPYEAYGLGFGRFQDSGGLIGHDGQTPTSRPRVVYDPVRDKCAFVCYLSQEASLCMANSLNKDFGLTKDLSVNALINLQDEILEQYPPHQLVNDYNKTRTNFVERHRGTEIVSRLIQGEKQKAEELTPSAPEIYGYTAASTQPNANITNGRTDFLTEEKMSTETVVSIASVSKMFTAATILKMMEDPLYEEKFPAGINTKLSDFTQVLKKTIPDSSFIANIEKIKNYENITMKHLLQHTAAIGNNPASPTFRADLSKDTTHIWSYGEFLNQAYIDDVDEDKKPGDFGKHSYSNNGYYILGAIIGAVSGKDYGDMVRELVINPLGLQHTYTPEEARNPSNKNMSPKQIQEIRRAALGYTVTEKGLQPGNAHNFTGPAGGILSTPQDINKFTQQFLSGNMFKEGGKISEAIKKPRKFSRYWPS